MLCEHIRGEKQKRKKNACDVPSPLVLPHHCPLEEGGIREESSVGGEEKPEHDEQASHDRQGVEK